MLARKIKHLRQEKGISQSALGKLLGVRQSTVAMWECGKNNPEYDTLLRLAELLDVSVAQLAGEESRSARIPVLGKVQAGIPSSAIEDIIDHVDVSPSMMDSGEYFALRIRGRSMEPRFCEGDTVIVRRQSNVENGEIAIVLVGGDDATCKKFYRHSDGISLVSLNPDFSPMFFDAKELQGSKIEILGKVCELRAKF